MIGTFPCLIAFFLGDIETGKKRVSAKPLAQITKVLKIEIFEFSRLGEKPEKGISAMVIIFLDG
jgi:hypothetical protein